MSYLIVLFSLLCVTYCVYGASNFSSETNLNASQSKTKGSAKFYKGDNDYGYAEVRKGAFMFWWLYYAGGDQNTAYEKPLVIWIQGGPSIPASGVGNFMEIGPQDMNLDKRKSSWVNKRNVLFIDSPVGTGFSYVNDSELLVKNDKELAYDLVELMKQFLQKFPNFKTVPTHIFSQSYGGKIAPRFAYYLHKEIKAEKITMNLKSVGMGSAFVSPKDSNLAYPEYMYNMGYLDQNQYSSVKNITEQIAKACDKRLFKKADELRHEMLGQLSDEYLHFNIFNVITRPIYHEITMLELFMHLTVKHALSDVVPAQTELWQFSNETVVQAMRGDIMKPSIHMVEQLLNKTNITLVVYNGNLDAATPIAGAVNWVHRLKWHGAEKFKQAPRKTIRGNGNGHYKTHGRLSFWWVYKSGHWVPSENPEAMEHILNVVVDSVNEDENAKLNFQRKIQNLWNLFNSPVEENLIIEQNNLTTPYPEANYTVTEISIEKTNWATEYPVANQTVLENPRDDINCTAGRPIANLTSLEATTFWTKTTPEEDIVGDITLGTTWNITTEKQDTIDDNTVPMDDVIAPEDSGEMQE